jgi:Regulator of ribonuclease activity B
MGFLGLFNRGSRRFWTKEAFHQSLAKQLRMNPAILERLAELSVGTEDQFKLEYSFHTDSPRKASALAGHLEEYGCQVERYRPAGDERLSVVTGRTPPTTMSHTSLQTWTERMCRLGFEHDCRFDGWRTTAEL